MPWHFLQGPHSSHLKPLLNQASEDKAASPQVAGTAPPAPPCLSPEASLGLPLQEHQAPCSLTELKMLAASTTRDEAGVTGGHTEGQPQRRGLGPQSGFCHPCGHVLGQGRGCLPIKPASFR